MQTVGIMEIYHSCKEASLTLTDKTYESEVCNIPVHYRKGNDFCLDCRCPSLHVQYTLPFSDFLKSEIPLSLVPGGIRTYNLLIFGQTTN